MSGIGFVIDASATLPWRFEDEATAWSESLLDRLQGGEHAIVPAHWPIEVSNALLVAQRRSRVTAEQIVEFADDLSVLPIQIEQPHKPADWLSFVGLAQRYKLSAYDAAYLELAHRIGLPLATLDKDLKKAARAEKIPLVEA